MAIIKWDKIGERVFEAGVKNGVLYPQLADGGYGVGVPWNGLSNVSESPEGGEPNAIYADDIKYAQIMSAEEFKAKIECFTTPKEFDSCDGTAAIADGINISQQKRTGFGFAYRTGISNDTEGEAYGYKIHLIYGAMAGPSEVSRTTIGDSTDPITFSYDVTTTPVQVTGHKATAHLVINSKEVSEAAMGKILDKLYGTADAEAGLPTPDEILTLISGL